MKRRTLLLAALAPLLPAVPIEPIPVASYVITTGDQEFPWEPGALFAFSAAGISSVYFIGTNEEWDEYCKAQ